MKRIVLTGAPGSGKTVITDRIARDLPHRFIAVPEAATQIYSALGTRWDKLDLEARRDVQRRIYFLQLDQEARLAREHPHKTLLLDRGTIDGAAYWPEGPDDYWRDVGTRHELELQRYDAVILLETCAALGLYDNDVSNPCRFEDTAAAIEAGALLERLWSAHPSVYRVDACVTLEEKIARVRTVLDELLLRSA